MRKILCALLGVLWLAGMAASAERWVIRLGVLTKLNTTVEEFRDTWASAFAPQMPSLEVDVHFYDSLAAMQMALNAGEISEMVLPEATADYLMNQSADYEAALVLRSKGAYGLSFGFREDSEPLRRKFNEALLSLRGNWTLAALEGHYIASSGVEEPRPVQFEKFPGADTIRVAVTGDLPPMDFIAADGTPAGFNTAVLAEVGRYLHRNVELVNIDAGARTAALASGRVDVVFWYEVNTSAAVQSDVPEGVILSEPYYEWNKFVHLRKALGKGDADGWSAQKNILDLYRR